MAAYVNANFVFGRRFIAAQAPPKTAMTHFWKMVWEQHVEVIVMLTNLVESGQSCLKLKASPVYSRVLVLYITAKYQRFA